MIKLKIPIQKQPDDVTCGPTCLQALYKFHGLDLPLNRIISEVDMLEEGGTLMSNLANHAITMGFSSTIYSFNLKVFDPTWRHLPKEQLIEKLKLQIAKKKKKKKLRKAIESYRTYLEKGGDIIFKDLTPGLIYHYLESNLPILAGLSSTYLYRCARENQRSNVEDDIGGEPTGHFVIISGADLEKNSFSISDPEDKNPIAGDHVYQTNFIRLASAILLGVVTYDANLLIIKPKTDKS